MYELDQAVLEIVRARGLVSVSDVVNDLLMYYNLNVAHARVRNCLNSMCVNRQGATLMERDTRTAGQHKSTYFVYCLKGATE